MKTWKMNLLDNRSDKKRGISDKFNFCKEKGIVGIGWVGYEEIGLSQDDKEFKAFKSAKSKLEQFDVGDLVWVKVPKEFKLWLCVIKSKMIKADDEEFNENDVGYYCECEYVRDFASKDLPKKVIYENLTTRSAISNAVDEVNDATNNIYQKLIRKKKSIKELFSDILKNIKKYWYVYVAALMLIIAAIVTISILNASKAAKVNDYIDGKIFIAIDSDRDYKAFSFSDGKIAIEEGFSYLPNSDEDGHVGGDITELANKYKVSASIFSDKIWIMTKYPHGYTRTVAVCVEDDAVKTYKHASTTPDWKEVTNEELELIRIDTVCKHKLETLKTLKEATCTEFGSEETICTKCRRTFLNEVPKKSHTYKNGKCIVCNSMASIQPNKWYEYENGLKYSNCKIDFTNKISMFNDRFTVKYYAVCEHCSKTSAKADAVVVYYGSSKSEYYRCKYCETFTYVKLKHEFN